jgi:N-acyl-D-amino-acid deacylase
MLSFSTRVARRPALVLVFLLPILLAQCARPRPDVDYDLIIAGALVIDGTGRPGFSADLGVAGRRLAALGDLSRSSALRVINGRGLVAAPGFIDIHTHCDRDLLAWPLAENFIRQGVTTVIGGNCGTHPYPLREIFRQAEEKGIAPNWGLLAGHNTIRELVMGDRSSPPSGDEMRRMKGLLDQEMAAGALGLSTGLSYLPGLFSDTREIVDLAGVAARRGGIYATHLRDQGPRIDRAIREAVEVGERNRMRVEISHIKLADESVWGRLDLIRRPLEEARRRGVEVTLDLYPYTATSTGLTSSFPAWSQEGGRARLVARLGDPAIRRRIKSALIERRFASARGINRLSGILIAACPQSPDYVGRTVEEILLNRGQPARPGPAAELLMDIESGGGASCVFFQMDEADVAALLLWPEVMIASDAGLSVPGRGAPHPRSYGTFPRVIGRYVHDEGRLSLEEAVRKMTSLPARVLRLDDRGVLRPGAWADIVLFDPERFRDAATYDRPDFYGPGLAFVLINGQIVLENGRMSGRKPGRVLYGPGRRRAEL